MASIEQGRPILEKEVPLVFASSMIFIDFGNLGIRRLAQK
jgi:hypothetical protein